MPDITPRLALKKPTGNENVTRAAYNENLDILEANAAKASDVGDMTTVPTTAKDAAGAITELYQDISNRDGYGTTAGTGAAYTVTLNPAPQALVDGLRVTVKIHADNTGAATLNVNGIGAIALKKSNGNDFTAGQLKTNSVYSFVYNGANFIAQGEGGEYGTAGAGDVRAGKSIGTDNGLVIGTLPVQNPGAVNAAKANVTLPAGIYDNPINITGGIDTSDATAVAADLRAGKSMYVNNAKVTGTKPVQAPGPLTVTPGDTDQVLDAGIYDGAITIKRAPNLPSDYIGLLLFKTKKLAANSVSSVGSSPTNAAIDIYGNMYWVESTNYNVYKYNPLTDTLTNLGKGAWSSVTPYGLRISDDGSVLYVRDGNTNGNGYIYCYNGTSWVSTGAVSYYAADNYFCCNPDGSELYFIVNTFGDYSLKKWTKSTNLITTIVTYAGAIGAEPGLCTWVDGGFIWILGAGNNYIKVRLSDGVTVASFARPTAFPRTNVMYRSPAASGAIGAHVGSNTGSGGTDDLYIINADGTVTKTEFGANYGYLGLVSSKLQSWQLCINRSTTPYTYNFLKLKTGVSAQYTFNGNGSFSAFALSEDGGRFITGDSSSSAVAAALYAYQ